MNYGPDERRSALLTLAGQQPPVHTRAATSERQAVGPVSKNGPLEEAMTNVDNGFPFQLTSIPIAPVPEYLPLHLAAAGDRFARHGRELQDRLTYLHMNPARQGLAKRPEDWRW